MVTFLPIIHPQGDGLAGEGNGNGIFVTKCFLLLTHSVFYEILKDLNRSGVLMNLWKRALGGKKQNGKGKKKLVTKRFLLLTYNVFYISR